MQFENTSKGGVEKRIGKLQFAVTSAQKELAELGPFANRLGNLYGLLKSGQAIVPKELENQLSILSSEAEKGGFEGIRLSSNWRSWEHVHDKVFAVIEAVHFATQDRVRTLRQQMQSAARARRALRRSQNRKFNLDRKEWKDKKGNLLRGLILGGGSCSSDHHFNASAFASRRTDSQISAARQAKRKRKPERELRQQPPKRG